MHFNRIKEFKRIGFGLFVHFGLYSTIGCGEWYEHAYNVDKEKYEANISKFKVNKNWAKELVKTAKALGAKYINITTRHHDGFSLYDTCGLSDFDAPHSASHRDLIKEFVDECNKEGIVPFFYHTLLDWHNPNYHNNFPKYIDYLIKSVKILCKNYGKIGGFWLDGYWDKPNENWQFDRLYSTIRKYQPEAIIINNTGLSALGEVSHYEIDAVTFERGKPFKISNTDNKDRAGEVCETLNEHWGYCENDICYKSVPEIVDEFIDCRHFGCNFLLNVGLMGDGNIYPFEACLLKEVGKWVHNNSYLFNVHESSITSDAAYIFEDEEYYYAVINNLHMFADENVAKKALSKVIKINTNKTLYDLTYLDGDDREIEYDRKDNSLICLPFKYGQSLITRTIRFKVK